MKTNFIQINHEITNLMGRHLEELKQYVRFPEPLAEHSAEEIITLLERLTTICDHLPHQVSCQLYEEARFIQFKIEDFLRMMNFDKDSNLENTEIGHMLAHAKRWTE